MKPLDFIMILLLGFAFGFVAGEHDTCKEVKGKYDWDYGTCEVRK